jgi:hypothetical protein
MSLSAAASPVLDATSAPDSTAYTVYNPTSGAALMPPTISTELFDALRDAGVSEERARAAAAAVVAPDDKRFAELNEHFKYLFSQVDLRLKSIVERLQSIDVRLGRVETTLSHHRWIMGVILALQVTILVKLFLA